VTADLSTYFDRFVKAISLDKRHLARMDIAASTLKSFLVNEYGLPFSDVFLQGSYPNRTVIEPVEGGEYDIDLVAVCVDENVSSDAALDDLERRLIADGRHKDRIVRKAPCVRLEYSEDDIGKFHVDVVPLRRLPGMEELQAPRRGAPWKQTAPIEYTQWCRDQGEHFTRTVKILKRWRDQQQEVHHAIKSIVLQVLISSVVPNEKDDATRITATFRSLHTQLSPLSAPPEVRNPVLPFENLAASWAVQQFFDFVAELSEAVELMNAIEATDDVGEAADLWRELFGPDFPVPTSDELGLKLLDTSHEKKPSSRGWTVSLDKHCSVSLSAQRSTRKRGRAMMPLKTGEPIPAGRELHFKALTTTPFPAAVHWQVVNTGSEAASDEDGLRGEIFEGHDLEGSPFGDGTENWECTKYMGCHEIRALLVANNQVVAASDYFKVPIFKGRQR
jgi:hypothetical protein